MAINLPLISVFNDKGVKDALSSLKGLGTSLGHVSKQLISGAAAFEGFHKGIEIIKGSINAARDLQRNLMGLETVFGKNADEMKKFAAAGVELGLSAAETAAASTQMGSALKNSGISLDNSTVLTKRLIALSSDLAHTYGTDVSEALNAMGSLFRGQIRPMERYGMVISAAMVKQRLQAEGLGKLKGAQLIQAEQLIRVTLLLEKSKDAQGAWARQAETLAAVQQKLNAEWVNMQASLGNSLIGPLTSLTQLMGNLLTTIGPAMANLFAAMGAGLGVLSGNIGSAANQIIGLINQLTSLVQIAAPVLGFLVGIASNFGAAIVTGIVVFKIIFGLITKLGVITEAFATIMAAVAGEETAAAVAAGAQAAAQGTLITTMTALTAQIEAFNIAMGIVVAEAPAVEAALVAEGVAAAATPWGAIAIVLGLLASGISIVMATTKSHTKVIKENTVAAQVNDQIIQSMASEFLNSADGYMAMAAGATVYTGSVKQLSAALTQSRADDAAFIKGAKAAARNNVKKTSVATELTPAQALKAELDKLKKAMNTATGSLGGSAKKAAKAVTDPFVTMVDTIKTELAKVHDSIVSAFDITNMGNSGGTIGRNIDKFMTKLRQFAGYIAQLKDSGLNGNLLSQLSMAGPENGLAAAKAFANSPQLVAQANAAYGELDSTAKAIAGNTVQSQAAPVYNITVTGGVGSGATIGKAVVAAIQQYELQSGPSWRK